MKKILLLLLVLPTIVIAQTRDSVYVKNEIFEIVYSEILQQPKKVTYEVQCPDGSASRKGMDFYRVQGVYTSDALDYEKNEWDKGHMAPAAAFQLQIKVCTRRFEKKRKTLCRQIRLVCGKCVFTLAELIEEFCTVC